MISNSVDRASLARRLPSATVTAIVILAAGCSGGTGADRRDDGLLDRADLQEIVDLQVARDAAGLVAHLEADDETVRARAAFALGSVQAPAASPALITALSDPSPAVRREAAFALGRTPAAGASISGLLQALETEKKRAVRNEIVTSIGLLADPAGLEALAAPERSLDPTLTLSLARGFIGGVANESLITRLTEGLTHRDEAVRLASAYAFGRSDTPVLWSDAAPAVAAALQVVDANEMTARYLLDAASKGQLAEVEEQAVRIFRESEDWRIRVAAVQALAGVPQSSAEATNVLFAALDDPSIHVGTEAGSAIATLPRSAEVSSRVEAWLGAHSGQWRQAAPLFALLDTSDDGSVDAELSVINQVTDTYQGSLARRVTGIGVLGQLPGVAAAEALAQATGDPDPSVASTAMGALVGAWRSARDREVDPEPYFGAVATAVGSPHPAVAGRAVRTLQERGFEQFDAIAVVTSAYDAVTETDGSAEVLAELVRPLGEPGDRAAEPLLRRALEHSDPQVSGTAAVALSQILKEPVTPPAGLPVIPRDQEGALPSHLGQRVDWDALAGLGSHPKLHLVTDAGDIVVELDAEEAPMTVEAIASIANAGLFDGVPFHRVVANFVAQGGDVGRRDGSGGPGFRLRTESTSIRYERGTIGMASAGRDTEGSQFFLTHSPQPHLDAGYTAFGRVTSGMDVVDRIGRWDLVTEAWVEPDR